MSSTCSTTYPPPIPGKSLARPPTRPLPHNTAQTPSPLKHKPSLSSPSPPTPLIPSFTAASRPPAPTNTNPAQYVTFQRPCPAALPDSPNSLAMMKRLLAKPAAPAGYPYSGSESEGRGVTRAATVGGWKSEDGERKIPAKSEERRRVGSAAGVTRSATMDGCRSATSTTKQHSGGNLEEEQRRIHGKAEEKRRDEAIAFTDERPSGGKHEGKLRDVPAPCTSDRRIPGKPEEKPRKLIRRKPSALPVSSPKRSMSLAPPTHPPTPSPSPSSKPPSLTPASALVEAYRAQEQRERVHSHPAPPPPPSAHQQRTEDDPPATPYYTVFGSSSDRVVPVDSREAHTAEWTSQGYLDGVQRSATVKSTGSSPSSSGAGGLRTLTRKVSGRWKKPQPQQGEEGRGRPSLGRKDEPPPADDDNARARSLSIEVEPRSLTRKVSARRKDEQARRGRPARRPSTADVEEGEGGNKLWRLVKRISAGGLRDKYRAESPPPPVPPLEVSKKHPAALTRLLPSTSTSSSRSSSSSRVRTPAKAPSQSRPHTASSSPVSSSSSKFWKGAQSSTSSFGEDEEGVPPVPVLNNNNNKLRKKKSVVENHKSVVGDHKSVVGNHKSVVGNHIVPPAELSKDFQGTPPSCSMMKHQPRPRTADSEEWMIVKSPDVELPSLPFPPRRSQAQVQAQAKAQPTKEESESGGESPLLPEFSISDVVNAFPARRTVDKPAHKPPTRTASSPTRAASSPIRAASSPTRAASSPTRAASSPTRAATSPTSTSFQLRKSESNVDPGTANRRSEGGLSTLTIRPGRRSSSYGEASPSALMAVFAPAGLVPRVDGGSKPCTGSAAKSPPIKSLARKLSSTTKSPNTSPTTAPSSTSPSAYVRPRHHTLTEQEKTKRWDDLLERSARAGGTLHLAGDLMLQSDTLRFSTTPSELSSVATLLV